MEHNEVLKAILWGGIWHLYYRSTLAAFDTNYIIVRNVWILKKILKKNREYFRIFYF